MVPTPLRRPRGAACEKLRQPKTRVWMLSDERAIGWAGERQGCVCSSVWTRQVRGELQTDQTARLQIDAGEHDVAGRRLTNEETSAASVTFGDICRPLKM